MNVLLYAPSLTGHPQVYCRVIGDILLEHGHRVTLAAGTDANGWADRWRDLRPFAGDARVEFVDTRAGTDGTRACLRAEELLRLQTDHRIDSTIFIEGDPFEGEFRRIAAGAAPRLRGRTTAIFSGACLWYPGEDPYTGARPPRLAPTLRQNLGRLKRALLERESTARHFYQEVLVKRRVVDSVVVKDERIAERFGPPVYWMPEIYRVWGAQAGEQRGPDWDRFAGPLSAYVRRAGAANVLLYFGTGAWYKGYDLFLRLAELDGSSYALHAGAPDRHEPGKPMAFDVDALRATLLRQGRLFETQAYVESDDLIRLVFDSVERFVSTHRLTLSSGTMLQALELGKPVLVPDSGLVGHRTRTGGLGLTYRYLDDRHLAERWQEFRQIPAASYQPAITAFMARFTRSEVARVFLDRLCN